MMAVIGGAGAVAANAAQQMAMQGNADGWAGYVLLGAWACIAVALLVVVGLVVRDHIRGDI